MSNNPQVRSLLARHGVLVGDSMAKLGAMKVELPVKAVEALAKSDAMNYISPDRQMESFGHVTSTTGADQVRNAPGLISSLLAATRSMDRESASPFSIPELTAATWLFSTLL
jgi:hypothetical protein